jgi:type II secretory pathway component PulM
MGKMLENWRYTSRLSRAVFVAVALLGVLLWTLWQWPAPMTSRSTQTGQVVSVAKDGVMLIQLNDGKQVHALTPQPVPKPGDSLQMIVETYDDGSIRVYIDHEAMRTGVN